MRLAGLMFVLFTVVPVLETWGIIEVGKVLGSWQTAIYLVVVGALGAWLGKRAGFGVLRELSATMSRGESPADKLIEAALVLVGATLLITPGFFTDLVGIVFFIAPVRRWLAPRAKTFALQWLLGRGVTVGTAGPGPRARETQRAQVRFDHPVDPS